MMVMVKMMKMMQVDANDGEDLLLFETDIEDGRGRGENPNWDVTMGEWETECAK